MCFNQGCVYPNSKGGFHPNGKQVYRYVVPRKIMRVILPQLNLVVKEKQRTLVIEALSLQRQGSNGAEHNKNIERLREIWRELRVLNKKEGV
jgi:hypothetical protein